MNEKASTAGAASGTAKSHGLLAEYRTPGALIAASKRVRDAGYRHWDTYTPFPVHGIDRAMGIKMTGLPWIVLACGLLGCGTGIWLQWWTNAVDYAWIISGKPFWSLPANVPVIFELSVLFSATGALFGMLALNGLPHPSHPLDLSARFAGVTSDKFFLLIQSSDPRFDERETRALLQETEPAGMEELPEGPGLDDRLPAYWTYAMVILAVLALVPFGLIAKARAEKSSQPRLHAIGDMDWQPKFKAQRANLVFADHRAMRLPVEGTVARGELFDDDHFYRGKTSSGAWARTFPKQVEPSDELMQRGNQRFGIYCTPCHGQLGDGNGMITQRAQDIGQVWVPPTNIADERLHRQPVGQLFNTVSRGLRNMPAYGAQIEPMDRWAIVMYVRALQRSRHANLSDLPEADRASLK